MKILKFAFTVLSFVLASSSYASNFACVNEAHSPLLIYVVTDGSKGLLQFSKSASGQDHIADELTGKEMVLTSTPRERDQEHSVLRSSGEVATRNGEARRVEISYSRSNITDDKFRVTMMISDTYSAGDVAEGLVYSVYGMTCSPQ